MKIIKFQPQYEYYRALELITTEWLHTFLCLWLAYHNIFSSMNVTTILNPKIDTRRPTKNETKKRTTCLLQQHIATTEKSVFIFYPFPPLSEPFWWIFVLKLCFATHLLLYLCSSSVQGFQYIKLIKRVSIIFLHHMKMHQWLLVWVKNT